MNKNVMIALVVVVVGVGIYMFMGGDQYADAADKAACDACDPAGVWTDAVGTDGEDGYVAGKCEAPAEETDGGENTEGGEEG